MFHHIASGNKSTLIIIIFCFCIYNVSFLIWLVLCFVYIFPLSLAFTTCIICCILYVFMILLCFLELFAPNGYAAAKSLQLCPTLGDPIDGSPPGSPVHGILQARTLERVATSFSKRNYSPMVIVFCKFGKHFSHIFFNYSLDPKTLSFS